jgi:hypothetical protein
MGDRGRRVVVRLEEEVSGVDPADDGAIVIQDRKAGAWRTRARMTPTPEDELVGLCALRDGGRAVLPGGYTLRQVAELIHSGGSDWALVDAQHSASGRLLGEDLVTLETLPFARSD